ncbi:MAG: cyclic nucleotide-binding domain-containing protein [Psychrilyobacter sp.]|nr:cyclic nucleotide-binding domain-containing protein [Psychrilyobacter sp.]
MKIINSPNLLQRYIELYNINSIFSNDLKTHMALYEFKKNEHIFNSLERVNHFFFLVSGGAKIILNLENGKSLLIDYCKPLDMLGEMEIVNNPYARYDVVASEPTTVIGFNIEVFKNLIKDDPLFWKYLYSASLSKLQATLTTNIISSAYTFEHVLANYIITHSIERDDEIFLDSINFSDLAQLLGTSYRHLNRVLKNFIEKGFIIKEKRKIIISNYEKLSNYYVEV